MFYQNIIMYFRMDGLGWQIYGIFCSDYLLAFLGWSFDVDQADPT